MASSQTIALVISSLYFFSSDAYSSDGFLMCLSASMPSQLLFTHSSPSFARLLASTVRNPRFLTPGAVRPLCIVTPTNASHAQAAVLCGRRHGVRLRVRSAGTTTRASAYRSARLDDAPFAVVDLAALRSVRVSRRTAWVDSGATLGELYHAIGNASGRLAFPAGLCPTVGVGGHLSGGGFGTLLRKHGLAADHVVDATLVDAEGRLLDRDSMGRDVFWAIRGGGGGSNGIVLSWLVKLVPVPPTFTVFTVAKTVEEGAVDVLAEWQEVAPALPDDLFVRAFLEGQVARFQSLYLGTCDALLPVLRHRFPVLGVSRNHLGAGAGASVEDILNRTDPVDGLFSKATSDYVRRAISRDVWTEIFTGRLARPCAGLMILHPYGAKMASVSESATPFPHRGGVMYNVQYMNFWEDPGKEAARVGWVRDMYTFMEPHVSQNPREAYANYRDLWLGENIVDAGEVTCYEESRVWGEKYYKGNFGRLVMAKHKIDPNDYFRNEQSIPPPSSSS